MVEYSYRAIDKSGVEISGTQEAGSEEELHRRLSRDGYILTESRALKHYQRKRKIGGKVKNRDLITFTYHFSALVSAGVPLATSLDDLDRGTSSEVLKRAIQQISTEVSSGATLSDSFSQHPNIFPPVYIHMIRAGELSGKLNYSLERIGEYLEWAQKIRDQVRKALIYPIILAVAVASSIPFWMTLFPTTLPTTSRASNRFTPDWNKFESV